MSDLLTEKDTSEEKIGLRLPKAESPNIAQAKTIDKACVGARIKKRERNVHKGCFGRAGIVSGREEYAGATALALSACLRSGAGYTVLFASEKVRKVFLLKYPEALLERANGGGRVALNSKNIKKLRNFNALAFGMGAGVSKATYKTVKRLIENYQGKLVLDADALNSLAKYEKDLCSLFKRKKCEILLTPHMKEFSRLTGKTITEILEKGVETPYEFAKKHGVCVLLKNAVSILSDGEEIYINVKGSSGQAKGGSGDALSGLIAGLCASGLSVFDASLVGAYIAGKAAEITEKIHGDRAMLASDVIEKFGEAFLSVTEDANQQGNEQ